MHAFASILNSGSSFILHNSIVARDNDNRGMGGFRTQKLEPEGSGIGPRNIEGEKNTFFFIARLYGLEEKRGVALNATSKLIRFTEKADDDLQKKSEYQRKMLDLYALEEKWKEGR